LSQLPETMDEVTLGWLEGVLAGHPDFDGVKIAQMRKTPVGEGVGQMSAIARLDLGYDGKPGPASIVVKLHAPFQGMRDVGIRYEMYARETAFYQSLAPEVTVSVPTIYFAGWDPGSTRNALVMEDMSHLHWPDQLSGHTLEQAQSCVDAIAQIGASHWGADFAGHDWLPDSHAPVIQRIVGDYQMAAPVALERLAAFTTPQSLAACERIAKNITWIYEALAEPPLILTHFDTRMENFVFASESSRELSLIDWQLMARLRPGYDIAYFLGTSIPEEMRRDHQAALRARYLAGLKAGGVSDYDEARFDVDFRLGTMAMTVIPILGGASFDTSNERSVALFGAILARSMASVLDNRCLELLPN
jgi:Ecdysteroid kinase-like family